jgi:sulfide dehydrogenase [flavocytochrome c] flavoprotein subunit
MKIKLNRRNFLSNLVSGLTLFSLSNLFILKRLNAKVKPKIVIIGTGIGGLSCLQYLYKLSDLVDIVVIDKNKKIRTGPFSNLVIGDMLSLDKITFQIKKKKYKNVKFLYSDVKTINSEKKIVKLSSNITVPFDFIILSPGIGYKENVIEGYKTSNEYALPHCWDGDSNISRFKKELENLDSYSRIVISSPDYPYRCPPAPYERASLIANFLKKKNVKFKILIFDSKNSFTKQENFFKEWQLYYKDLIEWIPRNKGGKIIFYDHKNSLIKNERGDSFKADFINIIPDQKASNILFESNFISKNNDWCQVNPMSFELQGFKDIFVVGDSINAWDMPKSAFSANSQAKVLAINLINKILGRKFLDPIFLNTCYSFSKEKRAFSISAWYRLNNEKNRIVSLGSSESNLSSDDLVREQEAKHAFGWYETLVNDLFL